MVYFLKESCWDDFSFFRRLLLRKDIFEEAFDFDIKYRINGTQPQNNTGYQYIFYKIFDGYIFEDKFVKVEAFKNNHGDLEESYGFVFETADKKIVFSGDTAPSERLLQKAKDADILIHEIYSQQGFDNKTPDWQKYHAAHQDAYFSTQASRM